MSSHISLDDLHAHLDYAKQKLSDERMALLALWPLDDGFNHEQYVFCYVRAERIGMQAIHRRLTDVAWLPMQLDPKAEIMTDKRVGMKRWLADAQAASQANAPTAGDFGNDFIHVLTRCGLQHGWTHPSFYKSAVRIANLFRDLSCLIGLVYYGSWLTENQIDSVRLTDPTNLCRSAEELTNLIQSPEMKRLLRQRQQRSARNAELIKAALIPPAATPRPKLRLIKTDADSALFFPDPVTV